MAEALLRRALAERGTEGVTVGSAGTGAWDGAPASEGAYLVALERGLDLSAHRARAVTRDLVRDADLILAMSAHHRGRIEALGGGEKVHLLTEYAAVPGLQGDVPDPFGNELDSYRQALEQLETLVRAASERVAAGR